MCIYSRYKANLGQKRRSVESPTELTLPLGLIARHHLLTIVVRDEEDIRWITTQRSGGVV